MPESYQHKLDRVRKPRVQITYDVETDGAVVKRELPFVVGVTADFSGDAVQPLQPLKDRRFLTIDRDNFPEIMSRMTPGANFRVENTLAGDGSEIGIQLRFNRIEDFDPAKVVEQVEPLRKLQETRNKLQDLMSAVDRDGKLEERLDSILAETKPREGE